MRINVDRDSPHFWRWHFRSHPPITIKVNEQIVQSVIEADDGLGYAEVIPTNEYNDAPRCHCGERMMSCLVFGRVEIIGKPCNG